MPLPLVCHPASKEIVSMPSSELLININTLTYVLNPHDYIIDTNIFN